jgi:hypothetical protein
MKPSIYVMANDPISRNYFINPPSSVCVSGCVSLLSLLGKGSENFITPFTARQRLGKHAAVAMNTYNNRRIIDHVIFYAVNILSKKSVCLCILLSLVCKNSLKTFPRQRRSVAGVVFYVTLVSEESRRVVFPRTSCT